jgi:exodeoxyribonuclease VII small subunit
MENKTFEQLMNELEQTLKKLENTDISLEEAVKGYTEGLELSKKCYEILTKNEELVVKKMTEAGLEDFKSES